VTRTPVVAIIGGGFSGTTIAYHLANRTDRSQVDILVIEPKERLGGGLAYSTDDPAHRINVPAAKMTMVSAEPEHFAQWLARDAGNAKDHLARTAKGDDFPQRSVFGRYVNDHIRRFLQSGRVSHINSAALGLTPAVGRYGIVLADGKILSADIVAIATTHPLPSIPAALQPLIGTPRFIADPYAADALDAIQSNHSVLVVGTGLTAADIIASLDRRGHHGLITAVSRHGYRSRGHAEKATDPIGHFGGNKSARSLLQSARIALNQARREGMSWHPVLDALRDQAPAIWDALPTRERRRLVRHLRSLWDVHRFRIAPQVEAVLDQRLHEKTLTIRSASLQSASFANGQFTVSYRLRHAQTIETGLFDAIIITTGPAHTAIGRSNPLIASLFEQGLLSSDPVGLGLHTARTGQAIGADGKTVETLYVGGPLARGTFGELMGVPEVTRYAEFIAQSLERQVVQLATRKDRQAS
jgi:uncharacterized NAD(P)/FAD-binding protein YdhS